MTNQGNVIEILLRCPSGSLKVLFILPGKLTEKPFSFTAMILGIVTEERKGEE